MTHDTLKTIIAGYQEALLLLVETPEFSSFENLQHRSELFDLLGTQERENFGSLIEKSASLLGEAWEILDSQIRD
ncbi:MAG: hypothetical protein MUE44_34790 [Oscillatoriaceae cyanobacterium Prado104]|jgi:hypothetical protein|nr:hypothetical protein [Oscillatoriaceae cyanobacterium Prado104]